MQSGVNDTGCTKRFSTRMNTHRKHYVIMTIISVTLTKSYTWRELFSILITASTSFSTQWLVHILERNWNIFFSIKAETNTSTVTIARPTLRAVIHTRTRPRSLGFDIQGTMKTYSIKNTRYSWFCFSPTCMVWCVDIRRLSYFTTLRYSNEWHIRSDKYFGRMYS